MTLTATEMHETLDQRGQLDDAQGPGVYALEVAIPDHGEQIARYWHRYYDHAPDGLYRRLADADTVLYVGASGNVYDRLQDHAGGDVRKAGFLQPFPPIALHSLWPMDSAEMAFIKESETARRLSGPTTRVWSDGELV